MKSLPLLLAAALLLASCAGDGKSTKATPPLMSQRMEQRFRKPDMNRRSIYDKSMQASLNKSSDTGSWFGRQKHGTKDFASTKAFTQTPKFKTNGFARAASKSPMGSQGFAQAGKVSKDADTAFSTAASPFAGQTARESSQTFSGANDTFKTSANRDALKSQQKNEGPTFIVTDEHSKNPAYSEEQVRKLLGRD
ncbi:MAG TPA: hypothetical protein VD994_16915 [Prosthecobacter sp.]|nr:hypothetical protein [Prosthecobacter sp.]